jgi:SAM-dependent methyltransferase
VSAPGASEPDPPEVPGSRLSALTYEPFLWLGERSGMAARRQRLLAGARGAVLEIGAGTGLNLPHYPAGLDRLVLSEPDPHMLERLRTRLARERPEAETIQAGAERLPVPDESFDTVVATLVLCTVPDPEGALTEVRRILRAGGSLLLVEHVRSEHPRWGRWQDRLQRPWSALADGCRPNCRTGELLDAAGFDLSGLEPSSWRAMPPLVRPLIAGGARVRS